MTKLYAILAVIAGAIAAIFMAFGKGAESATNKIKAKSEAKARESQERSSDALITGLGKEQDIRNENPTADSSRNHFN